MVAPIDRALETVVEEIVFEKKSPPPVPPKVEKKSVEAIPEESSAEGAVTKPLSPELTKKIDGLDSDSKTALLKDLHENVGLVESFEENCELVEAWNVLNGAGEAGLSGRIKDIEFAYGYLKKNQGKAAEVGLSHEVQNETGKLRDQVKKLGSVYN